MRIVGRGAFGKVLLIKHNKEGNSSLYIYIFLSLSYQVRIVEHKESHQLYALKYINKEECIKMDAVRNIIRERVILEQLDHPFLCRLRFAFQDNEYMYMATDLM